MYIDVIKQHVIHNFLFDPQDLKLIDNLSPHLFRARSSHDAMTWRPWVTFSSTFWLVAPCLGKVCEVMTAVKGIKSSGKSKKKRILQSCAKIIPGNSESTWTTAKIWSLPKDPTTDTWGHFSAVASLDTILKRITSLIGVANDLNWTSSISFPTRIQSLTIPHPFVNSKRTKKPKSRKWS